MPGVYAPHGVLLDAAGALQTRCAQTVQIPFSAASPVLGCVPMGILSSPPPICPAAPRRRGRKRRGNCLRAKPEFFRVPPSARSKGSPQGQDWPGCLFLVSSFGHAKEERENSRKAIFFASLKITGGANKSGAIASVKRLTNPPLTVAGGELTVSCSTERGAWVSLFLLA